MLQSRIDCQQIVVGQAKGRTQAEEEMRLFQQQLVEFCACPGQQLLLVGVVHGNALCRVQAFVAVEVGQREADLTQWTAQHHLIAVLQHSLELQLVPTVTFHGDQKNANGIVYWTTVKNRAKVQSCVYQNHTDVCKTHFLP